MSITGDGENYTKSDPQILSDCRANDIQKSNRYNRDPRTDKDMVTIKFMPIACEHSLRNKTGKDNGYGLGGAVIPGWKPIQRFYGTRAQSG